MCSTYEEATSVVSASATARLSRRTACDPPNTKRTGSGSDRPSAARAEPLSWPLNERIGVPVTKHLPGSAELVSGKLTANALAARAVARTDLPGTRLPSHISDG